MSDDLITSLRALAAARHDDLSIAVDAVIEIERQRAEIERLHRAHQTACEGGDLLRAEIELLRAALQESACACSSIRECASTWARQDECAHLTARNALEGKP